MRIRRRQWVALVALAMLGSACGDDTGGAPGSGAGATAPLPPLLACPQLRNTEDSAGRPEPEPAPTSEPPLDRATTGLDRRRERIAVAEEAIDLLRDRALDEEWLLAVSFVDAVDLHDYEGHLAAVQASGFEIEAVAVGVPARYTVHSITMPAANAGSRAAVEEHVRNRIVEPPRATGAAAEGIGAVAIERGRVDAEQARKAVDDGSVLVHGMRGRGTTEVALALAELGSVAVMPLSTQCGIDRPPDVIESEAAIQIWARAAAELDAENAELEAGK